MATLRLHVAKFDIGKLWYTRAHIQASSFNRGPGGEIFLSPDCAGPTEVKAWADDLIKKLEAIKRKADKMQWDNRPSGKPVK